MKELLEKWAEIEPDPSTFNWDDSIQWIEYPVEHVSLCPIVKSIQIHVQQAIEARGWDWKMHSVDFKDGKPRTYFATALYPRGEISLGSVTRQTTSPAEALLTAYLAALEAVKTEEVAG